MSASDKEKILTELRNYHTDVITDSMATESTTRLKTEFIDLEDKIINMILGYVNGKSEFEDLTKDVEDFQEKVLTQTKGVTAEEEDRKYFISKLDQLKGILNIASNATFKLRPPRYTRTAIRGTSGITTTQNEQ